MPRHHKPVLVADLEGLDLASDPAVRTELAHASAQLLIARGQDPADAQAQAATQRFVNLAEHIGLEAIAEVWAHAPSVSLPGSLWRLYVLRQWIVKAPGQAAELYTAGLGASLYPEVIAGVEMPPGPDAMRALINQVLTGVFQGDIAIALHRAAAFVDVCARGHAVGAGRNPRLEALARDLLQAATSQRAGNLE